ncbi:MAG: HAD hydrolase-like protein [Bradymonadales bacterium]|nr:HAD hydrolase-like protein [Bradymonadales bacterium]
MKLLLFDIDGTLIMTHGVGMRGLKEAMREMVGTSQIRDLFSFAGLTDQVIAERILLQLGKSQEEATALVPELFRRYLVYLRRFLAEADHLEVLPGVRELLSRLEVDPEFGLALGTGNIEQGARLKLEQVDLNRYFPVGGFGSDARQRSELLQVGVDRARKHYQTHFSRVWVVGDTPHDIRAGREIGASVLAVASGFASRESLAAEQPDLLLDNLVDVEGVVAALE